MLSGLLNLIKDPDTYKMSFPADHQSRKPPSNSHPLPLEPEVEPTDPILQSEVQEITEEEFLTNLSKVQSLALTCSQLRLPKSIRRDVDGMVQRLNVISKGIVVSKTLIISIAESYLNSRLRRKQVACPPRVSHCESWI
jgi:hypothetical protein